MRLFLLFLSLLASTISHAQQGVFVNAAYGWNWAASSSANVRFLRPVHFGVPPNAWHDRWDETDGSFAAGQAFWIEAGYRVSERLGISLAGRSVFSPNQHRYERHADIFSFVGNTTYTRTADKPFFLEPGLKIFLPLSEKFEAYLRAGLVLPLRHTIQVTTSTPTTAGKSYWQSESELRTNFSVGGFGGAGIKADLGHRFILFAQGGFGLLSLQARDETVQELYLDGDENIVDKLSEAERVVVYQRGVEYFQTLGAPTELPSLKAAYPVPFNYWNAEVGIGWGLK